MLKALIRYKEYNLLLDVPYDRYAFPDYLSSIGVPNPVGDIFIRDRENENISVKLFSKTSLGNRLLPLFNEDTTLSTVNTLCDVLQGLPQDQMDEVNYDLAHGEYDTVSDLFKAVKNLLKPAEKDAMSILFSKVELKGDDGSEYEFFTGGIPREYDDLENSDGFQEFIDLQRNSIEITAHVTTYIYGEGESENADENQLSEIKEHFEEPEWHEKVDCIEQSSFTFFYDTDELFGMEMEEM